MEFSRIIFVCRDNAALSPMAEAIFRDVYKGKMVEVASRGLVVLFEGPVNPKIEVVLGSHGLTAAEEKTRQIEEADVHKDTLLLAMNEDEKQELITRFPYAHAEVLSTLVNEECIEDPYGGNLIDYEKCYMQMSVIIKKLALILEKE